MSSRHTTETKVLARPELTAASGLVRVQGQLELVPVLPVLDVEQQRSQDGAGQEEAVEPPMEEFKFELASESVRDHSPAGALMLC